MGGTRHVVEHGYPPPASPLAHLPGQWRLVVMHLYPAKAPARHRFLDEFADAAGVALGVQAGEAHEPTRVASHDAGELRVGAPVVAVEGAEHDSAFDAGCARPAQVVVK